MGVFLFLSFFELFQFWQRKMHVERRKRNRCGVEIKGEKKKKGKEKGKFKIV